MKYIISRYEHNIDWISQYTDDFVLYDRSKLPSVGSIVVPNIGSDIYDKLSYIIDNYNNLPDVAVYIKANIFKYITPQEFDKVKDNTKFTPLLTQNHRTYDDALGPVCFYLDGIYYERNDLWYIRQHPVKNVPLRINDLMFFTGIWNLKYVPFAPGSNYILPKRNILKHKKEFYEKLRSYLDWDVYPGEAMIIERALYTIWK